MTIQRNLDAYRVWTDKAMELVEHRQTKYGAVGRNVCRSGAIVIRHLWSHQPVRSHALLRVMNYVSLPAASDHPHQYVLGIMEVQAALDAADGGSP